MKYAVIYESVTGNTKLLAEAVRRELGEESCICFAPASEESDNNIEEKVKDADMIFLGFWTDKGHCSGNIGQCMAKLHRRYVFLFGTAGFGGSEAYFSQILGRVSAHLGEDSVIVGSYMCQGRMPESVRRRYESLLEQNPEDRKIRGMIENFDRALAHPDEKDIEVFRQKIKNLKEE